MKRKLSCLILILSFCIATFSLHATTTLSTSYKQSITSYIGQLSQILNQSFTLAERTTFPTPESQDNFERNLKLLNDSIINVYNSVTDFYSTLPPNSLERRNAVLLLNAINLMQNNLFGINEINNASSSIGKMIALENYFTFRSEVRNTLDTLNLLIAQ